MIYLLAMRLPKMEYMGTTAVFFFLLNIFKAPFMISLGLITRESLAANLLLAPVTPHAHPGRPPILGERRSRDGARTRASKRSHGRWS